MQDRVYWSKVQGVDDLKQHLIDVWDSLEQSVIDDAIHQWRSRLRACVRAGHFEQSLKLAFELRHKLTFCLSLLKLNVLV